MQLDWMRADAPYMPIATIGLLAVISTLDPTVSATWTADGPARRLQIQTTLNVEEIAAAIAQAPLPDVAVPRWPTANPQALGPSLRTTPHPLDAYRKLVAAAAPLEARLLRAIATDQVLAGDGVPSRTRLLRGAKSDLSVFKALKAASAQQLARELRDGPEFLPGDSGAALGLVPEVQTFGGTTGRKPADVGAVSALLSRLLRHGILALPPSSGTRNGHRVVGGPLVTEQSDLSWPRWTIPCGPRELRVLFSLATVHDPDPDARALRERGIDAVFRSHPQQLSTTVAVFRWGRRVI
ncbi:MAG: hypothetical protein ACLP50_32885 [Solirubrobacteraceae bacterium]